MQDVLGDEVARDPVAQFRAWFNEAVAAGLREPHAMTLASADRDGRPSARVVLLKAINEQGLLFATNYASRKAHELDANPYAAAVFLWLPLERQVRVEGAVVRSPVDESDAIHAARPREAQLGAWASRQSCKIADRAELEREVRRASRRFPDDVPRPPHWGAYRLIAERYEFWQGRAHRLHDRFLFERDTAGQGWRRSRLAP